MFKTILIANRGEIASRIIKTCKKMGIETVAIYSTADRESLYVQEASQAFAVGGPLPEESYLNIDAIMKAAQASGADAIHPGYGFLSENETFAQACIDSQITFIGPSPDALKLMGSKQSAKQLLAEKGIPLIPGFHGYTQNDATLLEEANRIGFPVLIKAAYGGGGKGMRAVHKKTDFIQALTEARREASAYFSNDTVLIEKLLQQPRHIEVQILADNTGRVVHVFDRDCSIQRRHQKIIEEAPSPFLSEHLRQKITQTACDIARIIDYRGAGTLEFLVDDNHFYFMEMNTRLQVEHPVTECISGLDLVEWQINIAAGQTLEPLESNLSIHGHAIECRIYAEDPEQGFLPSIGQITLLHEPKGEGIRLDKGVQEGSHVSQYYDSMIAKLISWGETREIARARLAHALQSYVVGGIKTNLFFLHAICQHPLFIQGGVTTHFLNEEFWQQSPETSAQIIRLAAGYRYLMLRRSILDPLYQTTFAWQMHLIASQTLTFMFDDDAYEIPFIPINQECVQIKQEEKWVTLLLRQQKDTLFVEDGQQSYHMVIEERNDKVLFYKDNRTYCMHFKQNVDSKTSLVPEAKLTSPMPATVVALLKEPGDVVESGERLMILEAMKMEHSIYAPYAGTLGEFFFHVGTQVEEGVPLLNLIARQETS